jgi:hypothetical protein
MMGFTLVVMAIVARALAVVVLQSHTVPNSGFEHAEIAANLLAGRGFAVRFLGADGPTSQQAPVYPVLVALAFRLGGVRTPGGYLILEMGQALLGGLLVIAVRVLAREVAPGRERVADLAGLIVALYPPLIYSATHVQVAGLAATVLTATLAAAFRAGRTGRPSDALGAGALLGLLALTDPILTVVAPGMAWAVVLGQGQRRAIRPITVSALAALMVVSPWIVRNARVHGEFVAIKSTFGYAFWQGNSALSAGTDKVVRPAVEKRLAAARKVSSLDLSAWNASLWAARHVAGYLDDIALTADDYRALGRLSEPERSRRLFRRALDDLRADPARYPRLCLRRLQYFLLFDETNPKTRSAIYRVSHLGLTLLAVAGLLLAGREDRRRLAPTLLTAALITGFHTLTIVSARFHIPIEPLVALWAATGLNARQYRGDAARESRYDAMAFVAKQ